MNQEQFQPPVYNPNQPAQPQPVAQPMATPAQPAQPGYNQPAAQPTQATFQNPTPTTSQNPAVAQPANADYQKEEVIWLSVLGVLVAIAIITSLGLIYFI